MNVCPNHGHWLHSEVSLHYTGGNTLVHCYTIWIETIESQSHINLSIYLTSKSIIFLNTKYRCMCMHHFSLPYAGGRGVNGQDTRTRRHRREMSITLATQCSMVTQPTLATLVSIAALRELRPHKNVRVIVLASAGESGRYGAGEQVHTRWIVLMCRHRGTRPGAV